MKTFKRFLPDLLVALVFAVIAFAYFFPADTEGRILYLRRTRSRSGADGVLSAYGRAHTLDQLSLRRYANLSDGSFL